jgi:predicted RNase H-like nuclease (RuvC/YqgF family)
MVKPLGGRGKRAPYETTQMRVPIPIKTQLESLIADYRERVLLGTEDQDEDQDEEKEGELSDLETIKSQAEMIQAYASEIHFLKHKLEEINPLTGLEEAKESARTILRTKKSASQSLTKLLTSIYQVEVTIDDLK